MSLRPFVSMLALVVLLAAGCAVSTSTSDGELADELGTTELLSDGVDEPVEPAGDPDAESESEPDADVGESADRAPSIIDVHSALGRGINFGNSLEAPREGDWGVTLDASSFALVADAGFTHLRLPVSWAGYADAEAPYLIPDGADPTIDHPEYTNIWERVDWAIEQAEANGLSVIIDMHHYDEIHADPLAEQERFLAMWRQIAVRYADSGSHVLFELLNEPHQTFDVEPSLWNDLAARTLAVVRETNPDRAILIGPVGYNGIDRLSDLELPDDPNIIATVHVYEPFEFTHQGAPWVDPVLPVGTSWDPDEIRFPPGVVDYSWDTTVTFESDAIRVEYQQQWAGFSIDYQRSVSPTEVSFDVAGKADLRIVCREPEGETEAAVLRTTEKSSTYSVDLRGCASDSTGIFFQTRSSNVDVLTFTSIVICTDRGCEEMVQTRHGAIESLLQRAADWGADAGVPMHMGEFGTFEAAPLDDRAKWTEVMQLSALDRGLSTAYWEFNSGFGIWDPGASAWIEPLRDALLG